eukprot:COSAG02_NODE_1905_length_10437_cov_54.532643_6_plen_68_part_00
MAAKRAWVPPIEEVDDGETGLAKRRGAAAQEGGRGDEDTWLWADSTDPAGERPGALQPVTRFTLEPP